MKAEHSNVLPSSVIFANEEDNIHSFIPVHESFIKNANLNPDAIALIDSEGIRISYKKLDLWSDNVANTLRLSHTKGEKVAIISESQVLVITSILGVMKAGLVHLVIDPLSPMQRIQEILRDASVSVILTTSENDRMIKYTQLIKSSIYDISKLKNSTILNGKRTNVLLEDHAYIIYTSGSTGKPKGVLVNHLSLAASTVARNIVYPSVSTFLILSPFFCDSSFAGLWGTLALGGIIVLPSYQDNRNPEAITELINKYSVDTFLCIPSLYSQILQSIERNSIRLPTLKNVIVAAETLDNSLIKRHFLSQYLSASLFNEYGPTEATIWSTYMKFDYYQESSIGSPIPGISLYILDDMQNAVPLGEKGELFIGGLQVALGYLNNPEETDKRFFKDPFISKPGSMMYKTGDLVKLNENGILSFFGRVDNQVKIRGYRIEIEEVEKKLNELLDITAVGVTVVNKDSESIELIGCIVPETPIDLNNIRTQLKDVLPEHMIPSRFYTLEELPVISNGKIDRLQLLALVERIEVNNSKIKNFETTNISDTNDYISLVTEVWEQILNIKNIMLDVNFFDLGGHSLMVFKLQEMLQQRTGKVIPIVELFRNTTVVEQSTLIQKQ